MPYLNNQVLFGTFALITFILAGAAVGRLLGFGLGEAFYLATLVAVGTVNDGYRFIGQRRRRD